MRHVSTPHMLPLNMLFNNLVLRKTKPTMCHRLALLCGTEETRLHGGTMPMHGILSTMDSGTQHQAPWVIAALTRRR